MRMTLSSGRMKCFAIMPGSILPANFSYALAACLAFCTAVFAMKRHGAYLLIHACIKARSALQSGSKTTLPCIQPHKAWHSVNAQQDTPFPLQTACQKVLSCIQPHASWDDVNAQQDAPFPLQIACKKVLLCMLSHENYMMI